jgi:hypothetical protein
MVCGVLSVALEVSGLLPGVKLSRAHLETGNLLPTDNHGPGEVATTATCPAFFSLELNRHDYFFI